MRLGLGISLAAPFGAVFNPGTLALTGWWRAASGGEYDGSPWAGTASAGTSGSNALSEGTNLPSVGTSVNGYPPADFDTNDLLVAPGTLDTYFNASAYSGWVLVNVDAIGTDSATSFDNDAILGLNGTGYFHLYLRSSGLVGFAHYNAGYKILTAAISTGAWTLVQWKFDGSNMKLRVNGGAWGSLASGNLDQLTEPLRVGTNYVAAHFFNGKILDIGLSDTALSDDSFNSVLSYARARYALSL